MPIGRDEGKWFVWRGLRVVGKVAGMCERVFGGWGFCGGGAQDIERMEVGERQGGKVR